MLSSKTPEGYFRTTNLDMPVFLTPITQPQIIMVQHARRFEDYIHRDKTLLFFAPGMLSLCFLKGGAIA